MKTKPEIVAEAAAASEPSGSQQRVDMPPPVQIVKALRWLIIEHHSSCFMREELNICPICSDPQWAKVLNESEQWIRRHIDKIRHGKSTERNQSEA